MASNAEIAFEKLKATEGTEEGTSEWFLITQEDVNTFADLTHDQQFIHIDPERAKKETPLGGTIAHGFFTLSMLTHLANSIQSESGLDSLDGVVMVLNYGFDKIRFLTPVLMNSKIRALSKVKSIELKGSNVQVTKTYTVEIEGNDRPALVADWITVVLFS